jgi:hypothetical protein
MDRPISGSGSKARGMDKEFIHGLMEASMTENGVIITHRALELFFIVTRKATADPFAITKLREKASISLVMVQSTLVNGQTTYLMEKALRSSPMERSFKATGVKERRTVMVNYALRMEHIIRGSFKTTNFRVLANITTARGSIPEIGNIMKKAELEL